MNLQKIADELNKKLSFPYMKIAVQRSLSDHVYIVIGLEKPVNWANGYIENSRYIKAFIFCNSERWEDEESTYSFDIATNATKIKVIQKKNLTGEQVLAHVLKQLEKLN